MVKKQLLIKVLRDLAKLVDESTEEELEILLAGPIASLSNRKVRSASTRSSKFLANNPDIDSAIESLKYVPTRQAGFEVLERLELARADLQVLARRLDLPVMREDNVQRLMEKIVESSIGVRLNSQAIRGS